MSNLYIYNPTGEMAIANDTISYMPPKKLRQFESDLAFLPSFFASKNDMILTPEVPSSSFLAHWHALGLAKMEYTSSLKPLFGKINYIKPWSWNPVIHHKTKDLKKQTSELFQGSPNYHWDNKRKAFVGRNTTNRVQEFIKQAHKTHPVIEIPTAAISISSLEEFDLWMNKQKSAILKMPWSSSGRGIHIIDPPNERHTNYAWIKGAIKQQGYITAEPLLDKIFDFSFQLNLKQNGEINFEGISYFINDPKGHFVGGNIHWPHEKNEISNFLENAHLNKISSILIEAIKKVTPQTHYEGPIGVDAIVFKNADGILKIHPCLDINWRYNMGIVNIALPKFVDEMSIGFWKISSFNNGDWNKFIDLNEKEKPLIINKHRKIQKGFIGLTPPNKHAAFGAWMEVWPR